MLTIDLSSLAVMSCANNDHQILVLTQKNIDGGRFKHTWPKSGTMCYSGCINFSTSCFVLLHASLDWPAVMRAWKCFPLQTLLFLSLWVSLAVGNEGQAALPGTVRITVWLRQEGSFVAFGCSLYVEVCFWVCFVALLKTWSDSLCNVWKRCRLHLRPFAESSGRHWWLNL